MISWPFFVNDSNVSETKVRQPQTCFPCRLYICEPAYRNPPRYPRRKFYTQHAGLNRASTFSFSPCIAGKRHGCPLMERRKKKHQSASQTLVSTRVLIGNVVVMCIEALGLGVCWRETGYVLFCICSQVRTTSFSYPVPVGQEVRTGWPISKLTSAPVFYMLVRLRTSRECINAKVCLWWFHRIKKAGGYNNG